jgi:hypothetical protein
LRYKKSRIFKCLFRWEYGAYWKYCSEYNPGPGLSSRWDYRGKRCKESSPCGLYGYDYEWCYLEEGSWGYCSSDYDHIEELFWKGKQLEVEYNY